MRPGGSQLVATVEERHEAIMMTTTLLKEPPTWEGHVPARSNGPVCENGPLHENGPVRKNGPLHERPVREVPAPPSARGVLEHFPFPLSKNALTQVVNPP